MAQPRVQQLEAYIDDLLQIIEDYEEILDNVFEALYEFGAISPEVEPVISS